MNTYRRWLSIAAIMAVIFFQLIKTVPTLADDGVPPEETPVMTPTEVLTETAVPTEDPTPVEPTPEVTDEVTPEADTAATETPIPDAVAFSDPMWCMVGHFPGEGLTYCTDPQATITELITYLQAHPEYSGDGTIFFQTGDYINTPAETYIEINSTVLPDLGTLVMQGGWDLVGTGGNTGVTTFDVPLRVLWDTAVSLIDLIVNLPAGSPDPGIFVDTTGDITLENVDASGGSSGAELINYTGTGNVTVIGATLDPNTFSNNTNYGLLVYSSGAVTLNDVVAGVNNNGIFIDNTTGTGTVELDNIFTNGNGWTGIDIRSAGNIDLDTITANDNTVGVYLQTTAAAPGLGNIFVDGGTFNGNDDVGLKVVTNTGAINITGVNTDSADEPGSLGAWLKSYGGGAITVTGGSFNNADTGLFVVGTNNVTLDAVTANDNLGDGAVVESGWVFGCFGPDGIPVTVNGGTYQTNGGYGFSVYPGPDGVVTLSGTINYVLPNVLGDNNIDLTRTCVPPATDNKPVKPYNVVDVSGEGDDPVEADCDIFTGVLMILPDGSRIKMACPIEEAITITDVPEEDLPGEPPAGLVVLDGVDVAVGDVTLLPAGSWMQITFLIPDGVAQKHFSIMFWDPSANDGAGAWIELPMQQFGGQIFPLHPNTPEDGMLILGGVYQNGNSVWVKVNFTGTFILVAR